MLVTGIVLGLLAGLLGDSAVELTRADGSATTIGNPLTEGTVLGDVASGLIVAVPLVIPVGLIAGLRIVRLARTATGIERDQLRWRVRGRAGAGAVPPRDHRGAAPRGQPRRRAAVHRDAGHPDRALPAVGDRQHHPTVRRLPSRDRARLGGLRGPRPSVSPRSRANASAR
ncbi:hypothetical protein [Nocardioides sp. B-3]|uniref:hypothetical protein n=1 Tax=Nocardioides sp. B-3 TaxID=2895565 RepID=UPI0021539F5C|nr:hypothetical protein [Nocardioides sp. B-3]UUZ58256.1 hypothetical protein LP418_18665 [Nocardioides sp. B-3]